MQSRWREATLWLSGNARLCNALRSKLAAGKFDKPFLKMRLLQRSAAASSCALLLLLLLVARRAALRLLSSLALFQGR